MKKANLYIWLIALLSFPVYNIAQNSDFSLYFYNSSKQSRFEQYTNYLISPALNWEMRINGNNSEDKRINFDQVSRKSGIELSLFKHGRKLSHSINTGVEMLSDKSNLESELNPYSNKTGYLGYGTFLTPADSLRIEAELKSFYRKEQDRYLADTSLISKGFSGYLGSNYLWGKPQEYIRLNSRFESKEMDWEKYRLLGAGVSAGLETSNLQLSCYANVSQRNDDLYVLFGPDSLIENSRYSRYDRQDKKSLNAVMNLVIPMNTLNCTLTESYNLNTYRYNTNLTRNTGDYNNIVQLNLTYNVTDNIRLASNNTHNYYIKDLSFINNTRIIDTRVANLNLAWEYLPFDSLLVDYTIELRRTLYPDSDNRLDSDYLNTMYKLGWIFYYKDRLRLSNRIIYLLKEEVFIDSWLSAYNNKVTGYQWQPDCDILIGDSFIWGQSYTIRADYDDYFYKDFTNIKDTFYRKVSAVHHLIYDNSPLVSKSLSAKWSSIPYRPRVNDAWRIDLSFGWERNETSAKDGNIYYINGIDERQTISCLIQKQTGIFIWQLTPKYIWGHWKEYNLLLSSSWRVNSGSFAEIALNPVGTELNNLDWRVFCSLNLMF